MKKKHLIADFAWNIIGQVFVIVIGIIKNPIYTKLFSPAELGQYTLIETTFQIANIFLFGWLAANTWRYYNSYQENIKRYKQMLSVIYLLALILDILGTIIWYSITKNALAKELILLSGLFLPIQFSLNISFVIFRLEMKPLLYNIYRSIHILFIFGCTILGAFIFELGVTSLVLAQVIITLAINIWIKLFHPNFTFFIYNLKWKDIDKKFITFGLTTIAAQLGLILLTSSDRYIINIFENVDKVGIYSQVYNLSNVGIAALVFVIINTFSPYLNKLLTQTNGASNTISNYVYTYCILILFPVFWVSMHADEICQLLLNERYQEGASILPFVAISSAIYGVTLFFESALMFQNKFKAVVSIFSIGIIINIVSNYILIPIYDYHIAGHTTLVSYFIIFLLFVFKVKVPASSFTKKQISFGVQLIILLTLNYITTKYFQDNLLKSPILIRLTLLNLPYLIILAVLFWKNKNNLELDKLLSNKE